MGIKTQIVIVVVILESKLWNVRSYSVVIASILLEYNKLVFLIFTIDIYYVLM